MQPTPRFVQPIQLVVLYLDADQRTLEPCDQIEQGATAHHGVALHVLRVLAGELEILPDGAEVRPRYLREVDEQVYPPEAVYCLLHVGQDGPELLFGQLTPCLVAQHVARAPFQLPVHAFLPFFALRLLRSFAPLQARDGARIPVNADVLSAPDAAGRYGGPEHGRDAVLSRHDRAMAQGSADVRDHRRGHREERRPSRRGDGRHEHLPRVHLAEVLRAAQHARRGRDLARAGGNAPDGVAGLLLRYRRHPPSEELDPGALREQLRGRDPPLSPPEHLAPPYGIREAAESCVARVQGGGHLLRLVPAQPEDIGGSLHGHGLSEAEAKLEK